jgi:hypothetical protein
MAEIAYKINMYAKTHLYIDDGKFENENLENKKYIYFGNGKTLPLYPASGIISSSSRIFSY